MPAISSAAIVFTNGNFEDTSGTFPNGWVSNGGSATAVASIVPTGSTSASITGTGIRQDFAATTADSLATWQVGFAFRLGTSLTNAAGTQRIRFEGDNGLDMISMRFHGGTAATGDERIEFFNPSGGWTTLLDNLTVAANTTYYIQVNGTNFGNESGVANNAGTYTVGFSTDGSIYNTSASGITFHLNALTRGLQTVTFESGANGLTIDNVTVSGTSVPEPAAAMLGAVGSLALLRRRTR